MQRITDNNITKLEDDEVFVFGSNIAGIHGKGAAKLARDKFGADWGQGVGLQGQAYGIPTKNATVTKTLTTDRIKKYVKDFTIFAENHPNLKFLVTEIGCGLAGYKPTDIAPLFGKAAQLPNVYLPLRFHKILNK